MILKCHSGIKSHNPPKLVGLSLIFLVLVLYSSNILPLSGITYAAGGYDYEIIVDHFSGSWYSHEPLNLIRRGDSIILSFNNLYSYVSGAPQSWFLYWYDKTFDVLSPCSLFLGFLVLENAVITSIDLPPSLEVLLNHYGSNPIPHEVRTLFDAPINDSDWDFGLSYCNDTNYSNVVIIDPRNKPLDDEIALINSTTVRLLSEIFLDDIDRLTIHIKILAHPAYVKMIKTTTDSKGIPSTVPYISVGSTRANYSFGEPIPLTRSLSAVPIPAQPEVYVPNSYNNFFAFPHAIALAESFAFSLLFALPIPLYILFAHRFGYRHKHAHPFPRSYRHLTKKLDSSSKLRKAIEMHKS